MAVHSSQPVQNPERDLVPPARQPVMDLWDRVTGYRISSPELDGGDGSAAPSVEQLRAVVADVSGAAGRAEQALVTRAHLPVTRPMLSGSVLAALRPEHVVLRVRHRDAIGGSMRPLLARAVERGYGLELDELPGPDVDTSLLGLFMAVEIDLPRWALDEVPTALAKIRGQGALAVAAGVRSHAERERARSLGFEWFTGSFFPAL